MAHNWRTQLDQAMNLKEPINDLAWLLLNIGVVNDPSEVSGISYTTPDGVTFLLSQQMKGDDILFILQIDRVALPTQYCYLPSTDNDMRVLSHLDRASFQLNRHKFLEEIASHIFTSQAPDRKHRIAE